MNPVKLILYGLLSVLVIAFSGCKEREITNPFDSACPKEVFTPTDFKAEQLGTAVKLSWKQANTQISGFVINRNENDGTYTEIAKVEKSNLLWNDNNITGGKKYGYQLYAYAGENLSNAQTVTITPLSGATVTTAVASGIAPYSAVLGGTVSSDGGATVTERGVCYGTTASPTIASNKLVIGSGIGEFSNTVSGLMPNTTYYVKAYAINSKSTAYGAEVSFTTSALLLSVSPAIYNVAKEAGSRVFTVNSNIDWQASSNQPWCTLNVSNGKGNSSVIATFEANTTVGQRSAALTFSGTGVSNQVAVITQEGTEPAVLSIAPANQNVTNTAGTTTITITSNVSWTATSDQAWCKIVNSSGSGNAVLTVNFDANTNNSQRVATLSIIGLGLSAKTVTITQQPPISTEGLVAYYPFNGNANDESGNNLNCDVKGTSMVSDRNNKPNTSMLFNGNSEMTKIDSDLFDLTNNFSICFWIYLNQANRFCYIIDKHHRGIDNDGSWGINISASNYITFDATPFYSSSSSPHTTSINASTWIFIVYIYEKTSGLWKFYKNGHLDTQGNVQFSIQNTDKNFNVGYDHFGPNYGSTSYLNGVLDDIRIYNRTLTEIEIQQLYNE